ncbi:MAG: hypothetical protein LRY67_00650 [Gammaproteobacteria bacterium]|nr:hypothetical protein [Gammaproteobacteria bacterium]MCD8542728.1 hypothetical protein [Gammaproteobacteria bacterium]
MNLKKSIVLLITHAPTGTSFIEAMRSILPENLTEAFIPFDIYPDTNPEKILSKAQKIIHDKIPNDILFLTDLTGATPFNLAQKIIHTLPQYECALISGVSLAMLIKTANYQTLSLREWVSEIRASALQWIE